MTNQKEYFVEKDISGRIQYFIQSAPKRHVSAAAHIHDAVEVIYVLQGSYTVLLDDESYLIGEGDMVLFCSGAIHHITSREEEVNSYFVIKIDLSLFWELIGEGQRARYGMRFALNRKEQKCFWNKQELQNSPILSPLERMLKEYAAPHYATEIAMRLYAIEILVSILQEDGEQEELPSDASARLIYEAILYIRKHYAEDIDEQTLSKQLGMSYSYFSRTFRRVTGKSFRQYLNEIRINRAERKLLTTSKTVSEIATECGYNNLSYFISLYRNAKGETPRKTLSKRAPG